MPTPASPWPPGHLGWLAALVTAWGASSLYLFSDGAIAMAPDMLVLYVGAAVVGMAILGWIIAGSVGQRDRQGASGQAHRPHRRWPWLAYAFLWVAVVPSLCRYAVPFKVRLGMSERALIQVAQHSGPDARAQLPGWIGWLHVSRVDAVGPTTRFFTGACAFGDECGVAYSPGGEPPRVPHERYERLRGPWWAVVARR